MDARTGQDQPGAMRLPGLRMVYASPAGAAGRVYAASRNGAAAVLDHANEPKILAVNRLDDAFSASPALAGDALFLRGENHLYCLAKER